MNNKTGKYTVPEEVKALKPAGIDCTVKLINKCFYVYSLKCVPDSKRPGKLKKTSDVIIGKIEGGKYIPNEEEKQPLSRLDITTKDYGEYAIALACSQDVLCRLETVFTLEESRQIYALGIVYFVEGFIPASYIKDIYDQSVLSLKWPSLPISENSVHSLLEQLGLHNLKLEEFQQALVDSSSGLTALDGHVILSCSIENDLAEFGNKYIKYGNKQTNVMMAYDLKNNEPLTCKAFDGSVPDKVAVRTWFETYHFKPNTMFVVDMGFYSEDNLGLYRSNESHFIIPVPENTIISKMMLRDITFTGSFQYEKTDENGNPTSDTILFRESTVAKLEMMAQSLEDMKVELDFQQRLAEYEQDPEKDKKRKPRMHKAKQIARSAYPNDRVIMYRNETMHKKLSAEYLSQIGQDDNHTETKYRELEPMFGVILLRLNSNDTPEQGYCKYKKRWRIETNYNHIRNDADFNNLQVESYSVTQGMSFLMLIEDMIYRRFMRTLRVAPSARVRHMSKQECIRKASHAKVIRHSDGRWHGSEVTLSVVELLSDMMVSYKDDLDKLDKKIY